MTNCNFIQLKKNLPLNHHIIKTKLPEYNVKTGDSGLLSGFVSSCPDKTGLIGISDNIQSIQLTVSDSQKCKNIRDGEFCVNKEPKLGLVCIHLYNFTYNNLICFFDCFCI